MFTEIFLKNLLGLLRGGPQGPSRAAPGLRGLLPPPQRPPPPPGAAAGAGLARVPVANDKACKSTHKV